jgi:hypothetical protein
MNDDGIDTGRLRHEVRGKYRDVALQPGRTFDFSTGRPLAERLGYPRPIVDALPGRAVESFAGIGNPFALRPLQPGENVLDVVYRFNLIAWCLTWGLCDQLRRLVVLVDHATEDLSPSDRQVQQRAGLAVLVGRSLLAGLVRAVAVVMAGVLAED